MLNIIRKYFTFPLLLITLIGCGSDSSTVSDTTPPSINLNGDQTVSITQGQQYLEQGATATDNIDENVQIIISGQVNTDEVGEYIITYTATDNAGNSSSVSRIVTVVPAVITIPEITLNGPVSLDWYLNEAFVDPGATANDETDGELEVVVTGNVDITKLGQYSLIYQATNSMGKTVSVERIVQVIDSVLFSLNGEQNISIPLDSEYQELGAIATDKDGNELAIEITNNINTTIVGSYTVTYRVIQNDLDRILLRSVAVLPRPENTFRAFADIDADESLDLTIAIYTGNTTDIVWRSGTIQSQTSEFNLIDRLTDELPLAIKGYDLNNTGYDDLLVITEKGWYVYYNQGNSTFAKSANLTTNWTPYEPNNDNGNIVGFSENKTFIPQSVFIEDISGDGIADLIWETENMTESYIGGYSTFSQIYAAVANSDFSYSDAKIKSTGYTTNYIAGSDYQYVSSSHSIKFFDVNEDNVKNIVKATDRWNSQEIASPVPKSSRLISIEINPNEDFHNSLRSDTQILDYEFVDWNKDGLNDIWIKQQGYTHVQSGNYDTSIEYVLLLGEGSGVFSEATDVSDTFNDPSSKLIDINGDGQLDIVFSKTNEESSFVYWRQADVNGFLEEAVLVADSFPLSFRDLNGDGRPELIKPNEQGIAMHLSEQQGTYRYETIFEYRDLVSIPSLSK